MLSEKKTLSKDERIYGTKRIDELFKAGESFISYPLRIVYMKRENNEYPPVSIMASVPKKKLKRAVKRNRIKRLVREAFRLNKNLFSDVCSRFNTGLDIVFIYLKDDLSDYTDIEKAILKTAASLEQKLEGTKPE